MAYYTRRHWTATANAAVSVKRAQVHATLHYPGFGSSSVVTSGWSRERCFQQLRAWRNMHVGSGAYKEVAYNLYALPTGDVVEGRGNRQNGANGNSASNRAGMSIQVLIGDNEPLSQGHLAAIFEALALLERWHPGITSRQYGHSHWVSTRCPGPKVRAGIPYRAGTVPKDGGGAGIIAGAATGLSDGLADVDDAQRWLTALGYSPGPIDGKFGDQTAAATRAFQTDFDITPADGRPGPATRALMEAAMSDLKKILAIVTENQVRISTVRTQTSAKEIQRSVWGLGGGANAPMIDRVLEKGKEYPVTTLGALTDRIVRQQIVPLRGEVAGLVKAVEQLAAGQDVDPDAIKAAVAAGVEEALGSLTVTVSKDD